METAEHAQPYANLKGHVDDKASKATANLLEDTQYYPNRSQSNLSLDLKKGKQMEPTVWYAKRERRYLTCWRVLSGIWKKIRSMTSPLEAKLVPGLLRKLGSETCTFAEFIILFMCHHKTSRIFLLFLTLTDKDVIHHAREITPVHVPE